MFVAKIPLECTEQELVLYFGQFGELKDVHLPVPKEKCSTSNSEKTKIAFVAYVDAECAHAVKQMKNHTLRGQKIVVDHAIRRRLSGGAANANSNNTSGSTEECGLSLYGGDRGAQCSSNNYSSHDEYDSNSYYNYNNNNNAWWGGFDDDWSSSNSLVDSSMSYYQNGHCDDSWL